MKVEEEMKILEEINKEIIIKGRLLYSYEIKEILDRFIVKYDYDNAPTVEPVKQCKYCKHCGNEDYCSNCHSDHSLFEYYERPQSDMLPVGTTFNIKPEDIKWNGGDQISRETIEKIIVGMLEKWADGYSYIEIPTDDAIREMKSAIDNAKPVAVNCKDCDGYEAGYSAGLKDAEKPQGDNFPMEIVAGKCPIEDSGNCPLKSQGGLTELTDEVWKLYKKHQSHLATYVLEFGEELADLLGKYNEGGAE